MKRLGELLVERGAIDVSELHTALETCHRKGGRLGTQLLRLGFVEERPLLEALAKQLGVPFLPEHLLAKAPRSVLKAIPLEVLNRLRAIPFERTQWRLRIAMASPRDPSAIEELTALSDVEIEPFVATEAAILKMLKRLRKAEEEKAAPTTKAQPAAAEQEKAKIPSPVHSWEELWQPSQIGPLDLIRPQDARRNTGPLPLLSSFPDLSPVIEIPGVDSEDALDDHIYVQRLIDARDRDEVASLLLRFCERYLERVCLFILHRDRVAGWSSRGQGVVLEDVLSFSIMLDESPLFLNAYRSGRYSLGSIPAGGAHDRLVKVLGEPPPLDLFVAPLMVRDRVIAFLTGDNPGQPGGGIPTQELLAGAKRASLALEMLIIKSKIMA
jgi:hypothetical protein